MKVAIIGTGIMGSGMATHFLKGGHEVYVWNRTKDKLKPIAELGAIPIATPREAAKKSDVVIEVTANDESSREVWLGDDGIIAGSGEGKVVITSATLSVEWTDELASICKEGDLTFFDMPLTGGRMAAESGSLTLLVGGGKDKLEEVRSTLGAISSKILHFGKEGSGMRFKLILNAIQSAHIYALGEALKIAKENGMDVQAVGEALADRPGGIITQLAWQGYQNEPKPINFSVNWIKKDLEYAKRFAKDLDVPFLDETLNKYAKAIEEGKGDEDWTIITKFK